MRTTLACSLLLLAAACGREPLGKSRLAKGEGLTVPAFSLTERSGEPLGLDRLRGKVWIGTIIFTRCQTTCIPMCGEMARLQDEFGDDEDFRMVAVTCDPAHDTPAVLADFAERYEARPDRWFFLTGEEEDIRRFAVKGLRLPWNEEDPVTHSVDFVLVDRDGQIRDYFRQTEPEEMKRLREVVREVLAESRTP